MNDLKQSHLQNYFLPEDFWLYRTPNCKFYEWNRNPSLDRFILGGSLTRKPLRSHLKRSQPQRSISPPELDFYLTSCSFLLNQSLGAIKQRVTADGNDECWLIWYIRDQSSASSVRSIDLLRLEGWSDVASLWEGVRGFRTQESWSLQIESMFHQMPIFPVFFPPAITVLLPGPRSFLIFVDVVAHLIFGTSKRINLMQRFKGMILRSSTLSWQLTSWTWSVYRC